MYEHILIPIDLDATNVNEKVVEAALDLATRHDATLHFLNVVPPLASFASTFFPEGFQTKATEAARQRLHTFTEAHDLSGMRVQHIVTHGAIYDQIIETAEKLAADLIVMASHHPEARDYLLGPNAARVVRHADCSVMVVRD
ncbi:universal stress protein [Roseibium sp. SCP14]|uniref:universal stress protein n=1 Tax=Roseibium sp. SCP14 TaxID=3141375 RepID=UPI003337955A